MKRLKQSEVKEFRQDLLIKQAFGICPICGGSVADDACTLDHSHQTGKIRGVLHRNCNCLLGRIENNCRRHCVPFSELPNWLRGAADYLELPHLELYHPSYRTEEEKKARRNKRAAKARRIKKELEAHEP